MRSRFALVSLVLSAVLCSRCGGSGRVTGPGVVPGSLTTLVEVTNALDVTAGGTGTFNWAGQSATMPAGAGFTNIRFNWYTFQRTPTAFGMLYILTQEFTGIPRDLAPSTPGFVARSESTSETHYAFASSVALTGGTKYWFYTDTQGSFAGSFDQDIYKDGDLYVTGWPTLGFHKAQASGRMVGGTYVPPPPGVFIDGNFRVQGSPK